MEPFRITLLVTTYNNPGFLELVLLSVLRQTELPHEVVIGDDGSGPETRALIDRYRPQFPCPLKHAWIEDRGFRLSVSRNAAVRLAGGDYIVMIDGDIVLGRHFVADHRRMAGRGCFVTGSRGYLSPAATRRMLRSKDVRVGFFTPGLKRRFVCLHWPWLGRRIKGKSGLRHVRGCHLAFWRSDFIAVNGFDETFQGWGREDYDFVQRLYHLGLVRRNAKLQAAAFHLWHPSRMDAESHEINDRRFQDTVASRRVRAGRGYAENETARLFPETETTE